MKSVKTGTRNVKQGYRIFTDEQRREIISKIDSRPSNVSIEEMFQKFGFGRSGSVYYNWKKKFGMKVLGRKGNVPMNVPMTNKMGRPLVNKFTGKQVHTVTLSVEVGSTMELINFCIEITKTPKVKSVLSVE